MRLPDIGRRRQRGFSIAEVLATIILLGFALGPAMISLQTALQASDANTAIVPNGYRLLAAMELVLAAPFSTVAAAAAGPGNPSSYSDAAGSDDRRLVFIANYDLDNADADDDPFTGPEADVLWIRVELEGTAEALEALKTQP